MSILTGEYKGFKWEIDKNFQGYNCGYVFITDKGHPWYKKHYLELNHVDVHGKLGFSDFIEGEIWVVGFDCGHKTDLPDPDFKIDEKWEMIRKIFKLGDIIMEESYMTPTYKDVDYVKQQCEYLIDQAVLARQEPGMN